MASRRNENPAPNRDRRRTPSRAKVKRLRKLQERSRRINRRR